MRWPWQRVEPEPRPLAERELTENEIRAALRSGEDNQLWRAVLQLLSGQIAAAVEETTDPENHLKQPLPTYYAGAARELQRFKEFLAAEREEAMRQADAED